MTAHDDTHHERPKQNTTTKPTEVLSRILYSETAKLSMMICERCGAVFDEPTIYEYRENLDGEHGWATFTEMYCPECGSDDLEDINDD